MVDVIVQFTVSLTDAHHQKIRNKGGQLKKELGLVKAGLYSMPAGAVDSLASDPEVVYISPDRPVKGMLDSANPTINAGLAFAAGWKGTGVGIAVIDSGIYAHPDLATSNKTRIVYSQSFVPTIRQPTVRTVTAPTLRASPPEMARIPAGQQPDHVSRNRLPRMLGSILRHGPLRSLDLAHLDIDILPHFTGPREPASVPSPFLPLFHRAPEAERLRSRLNDVCPVRDPVQ